MVCDRACACFSNCSISAVRLERDERRAAVALDALKKYPLAPSCRPRVARLTPGDAFSSAESGLVDGLRFARRRERGRDRHRVEDGEGAATTSGTRMGRADADARRAGRLTRRRVATAQFVRDVVTPVATAGWLREPATALADYVVGACVAEISFLAWTLATLTYKSRRKNGVNAWYGFLLGACFYLLFVMIGLAMFVDAFYQNFAALHDYELSEGRAGFFGSTERKQTKALMGLAFASAACHGLLFLVLLFWRDSICGETTPASPSRFSSQAAAPMPKAPKRSTQSPNAAFRVTPLSDGPASDVEMGKYSPGGGGSSLRFGADRFNT